MLEISMKITNEFTPKQQGFFDDYLKQNQMKIGK